MRRLLLLSAVVLVTLTSSAPARGDWQTIKTKWNGFWHRVHVDWHRNNAWPEPFVHVDRQAVQMPIDVMVDKGWQLQNTISHQLFNPETHELTQAGELKVRWILTQMPPRRRSVFVLRGNTPEITETRLRSVEQVAAAVVGDSAMTFIAVTDVMPREGSGSYYERVSVGYDSTIPPPRLPAMDSSIGGN